MIFTLNIIDSAETVPFEEYPAARLFALFDDVKGDFVLFGTGGCGWCFRGVITSSSGISRTGGIPVIMCIDYIVINHVCDGRC